ncbi:MAG: hypothetical protein ACM3KM_03415 [Acidobacteriaceae bacterium]
MAKEIQERNVIYDDGPRDQTRYSGYNYYSPVARLIWTIFGIVAIVLALRFILRAIGADPAASFTSFIYDISAPLIRPFSGTIANNVSRTGVVEWVTVLALVVYWIVAWILARLASITRPVAR